MQKRSIKLDWLTKEARTFLKNGYIYDQTPEERYIEMAEKLEEIAKIEGFADRVIGYIEKAWISFASPEIANFGKKTGLPASCNFLEIQDTIESISEAEHEMSMLAANGAGTARDFSKIRAKGKRYGVDGKSEGVCSWIESYALKIKKVNQGGVRRGFLSAYLSVEHEEIGEFIKIGEEGHPITWITTGVTIPEGWMEKMLGGDKEKQQIFKDIHVARAHRGYPYILFEDNANKGKHQVYIDNNMHLHTSNICTECIEWTDAEKEFVCVLASINLEHWDEIKKDPNFIFDCNLILDCFVTEYIEKAKKLNGHKKAVKFAEEHRAIGLGVMGFHAYLQQNSIVFGSLEAGWKNIEIFKKIREESDRASKWMAKEWGEPKMLKGYGDRNTSRIAIAPTKSSSNILSCSSEGTQVIKNNYHSKDLAKIQIEWKNPYLKEVLKKYGKDTEEIWDSILIDGGSVQKLDFLTKHEKAVFRTALEISQLDIVKMAAQRQKYIDQAQSTNLYIPIGSSARELIKLSVEAWRSGLKTLYYQYNVNSAQELTRSLLVCESCSA